MRAHTLSRRDREFLPAALEVLETPSSPRRRALLLTLCLFVTLALAWSFTGRVDIEAVAKGKVEPQGRVKVIEPLEPGRVLRILVEDGAQVRKGDALVEFDPAEMDADEHAARQALSVELADAARYGAAVAAAVGQGAIDLHPAITWDDLVPEALRQREGLAIAADLHQLAETLRNLDMLGAERQATRTRLDGSIAADERLVATLQQRVDMRQTLVSHDNGTRASLIDAVQDLERAQSTLVADRGSRSESTAAIGTIESDKAKALSQFVADSTNKLNDAANKAAIDRENLAKAVARSGRTSLTAPVDGIVQKLAITTVGQVVTTGQELMTVVPTGDPLNIAAFVDNTDIGFVKPGQDVVIKFDAFPFTRYGTLDGKVVSVATDAIDEGEARRLQANVTSLVNSSSVAGASDGQNQKFVFPVRISLGQSVFRVGEHDVPLTPGMSVTAEIKTDRQRLIDYVLSPLTQTVSEALHER